MLVDKVIPDGTWGKGRASDDIWCLTLVKAVHSFVKTDLPALHRNGLVWLERAAQPQTPVLLGASFCDAPVTFLMDTWAVFCLLRQTSPSVACGIHQLCSGQGLVNKEEN